MYLKQPNDVTRAARPSLQTSHTGVIMRPPFIETDDLQQIRTMHRSINDHNSNYLLILTQDCSTKFHHTVHEAVNNKIHDNIGG